MAENPRRLSGQNRNRLFGICFSAAFLLLGTRVMQLTILPKADTGRLRPVSEDPLPRPDITDRNGVLLATDAAGEGVNLQNANLMVNYDLPWNPNRLEQRFGRIHRIGQTEVCRLWNLVAKETREGAVYHRLLEKLRIAAESLQGKVFDVLGEVFENVSLKDLLI